uniref:Uncharacterized protein n=1 Tax=Odontella aurita TaxID=265563 RepID=A0A7S4IY43_9STRA|mmetsp:Transcript_32840/g.97908  ORF Transcript_32840/g.97908 Transcript_32840/m.97908 type:complete len:157 (+) Transcript_32840:10-480(+)
MGAFVTVPLVGGADGAALGLGVGRSDGSLLGIAVGASLGSFVASFSVGGTEGGAEVERADGGPPVADNGAPDGAIEDIVDGFLLGIAVGALLGSSVVTFSVEGTEGTKVERPNDGGPLLADDGTPDGPVEGSALRLVLGAANVIALGAFEESFILG